MTKVNFQLICTLLMGLMFHTSGSSQSVPTFTGHAATDFITTPGYMHFNDFVYDVGLPAAAPAGTITGWDIQTTFFFYDPVTDNLYVGVDFAGIFGDADGDGNPSSTSSWLGSLQGTDHNDLGNTEGFILAFDNGNDSNYDVYIGVSRIDNINDFGIHVYTSDEDESPEFFPVAATGSVSLHSYKHDALTPDLEFMVEDISNYVENLCGTDFIVFAGSYEDGPIGEDHMDGRLEVCLLPMDLIEFKGDGISAGIELSWSTATENGNDYFEIQHATDMNSEFETIGRVDGNGTTYTASNYEFLHASPVRGNNYYRIRQVDNNGKESYSWVVTQYYESPGGGRDIDVFPNPNLGEFTLSLPNVADNTEALIRIVDSKGAVVSEIITNLTIGQITHSIDIKGLSEGVYHLSLTMMSGKNTYNKSFMVR